MSRSGPVHNKGGLFGAYAAGFLHDVFGVASLIWPLVFGTLGAAYVSPSLTMRWLRWCGFFLLTLCLLVLVSTFEFSLGHLTGGGMLGDALSRKGAFYLSPAGSFLLWVFCFLVGMQLSCDISWISIAQRIARHILDHFGPPGAEPSLPQAPPPPLEPLRGVPAWKRILSGLKPTTSLGELASRLLNRIGGIERATEQLPDVVAVDAEFPLPSTEQTGMPINGEPPAKDETPSSSPASDQAADAAKPTPAPQEEPGKARPTPDAPKGKRQPPYPLPSLELLQPPPPARNAPKEDREARGNALIECLLTYNIQCELTRITPGPVLTMFEIRPAPGIRVNRISNLSDDLARALKAIAIRIQAPIPGSDTVGIEIPNAHRETVTFRELAATEAFRSAPGPLTFILGKDISGKPIFEDLSRMPHMLVAGSTGAGKSVCLNSIIVSLLYRSQPDFVKLLLVDPKRIEFSAYADEPHLIHPVVTDAAEAENALKWAVHEMDARYQSMARLGVRDMASFNAKLASHPKGLPADLADLTRLPYIVIVIDELADLMMLAGKEVESSVMRLAQLARAAGIHVILATQRPSVDVITGTIKSNFPCRISFQVASKHDSRTILDQIGAEYLLRQGDMLFKNSGGRLQRIQGPYLTEGEVERVVAHWKEQASPDYMVDFSQWNPQAEGQPDDGGASSDDPLYDEVKEFVREMGKTSISQIQRRFRIGYNKAARLVEQLERDGVIGPADGSKPRHVVK